MSPSKIQRPVKKCLCFIRFRDKHTELNEIYWQHVIGSKTVIRALQGIEGSKSAVESLGISTTKQEYGLSVQETIDRADAYLNRARLHILAICCANLESFLHEAAFCYILSLGHKANPGKLTVVGEALGSPILDYNSLPRPLEYSKHLFGVDFGDRDQVIKRAYKLRCAVVHNGGVVLARTKKELKSAQLALNSKLEYSWGELKSVLEAVYEVAAIIEGKINTRTLRLLEVEREYAMLFEAGEIKNPRSFWTYLHELGSFLPNKNERKEIIKAVNAASKT